MDIATIGFTRTSARDFFDRLKAANLPLLVDVRLNKTSQLAGFAKGSDLPYFLREICGMDYREELLLAPEADLLAGYRAKSISWDDYVPRYRSLVEERDVANKLSYLRELPGAVLLCSEPTADQCHRRLAAEFLAERWEGVRIRHL